MLGLRLWHSFCLLDLNKDTYTAQDMKAHTGITHVRYEPGDKRIKISKFIITQIRTLFSTYNFTLWNKPTYTHRTCMHAYMHIYICMYTWTSIPAYGHMNVGTYRCTYIHTYILTYILQAHMNIWGMLKKNNSLNSTPTSTEGTLWLLSTPHDRFWQQTAICPISLWALVVKPHLLNWARALAVLWISDKVTMKGLEEQCVCVWNHNRRWDVGLWVWWWNQDAIVAVDGERVSSTKKKHVWVGQRSRWCWLCFFIGKALSIMNLYHVVRW